MFVQELINFDHNYYMVKTMSTVEQDNSSIKRRSKGEKTKLQILEAAIITLAKLGIKGTTHRAIAKEADIQLSLTTYYFRDIDELIQQAIILNSENIMGLAQEGLVQLIGLINKYDKTSLKTKAVRTNLAADFSEFSAQYLYNRITTATNALAVEQILFANAKYNPNLENIAKQHKKTLLDPLVALCSYFNKVDPALDAEILLAVILQIKYHYISVPIEAVSIDEIRTTLNRIICFVLRVKV